MELQNIKKGSLIYTYAGKHRYEPQYPLLWTIQQLNTRYYMLKMLHNHTAHTG